jgi:ATP-dependent helicase HrpA
VRRLAEDVVRDEVLMSRIHEVEDEYDRLVELLPPSPELAELAWALQELRVSLFAQSLGTRGKVSERRIAQALAKAAAGA